MLVNCWLRWSFFFFWIAFQSILRHQFHPSADSGHCYKNRKILKKMEMLLSEDLFVRRSKRGWQGGWEREACSRRAQGEQWGAKGVLVPQLCTAPGAEMAPCDSTVLPALRVIFSPRAADWSYFPGYFGDMPVWGMSAMIPSVYLAQHNKEVKVWLPPEVKWTLNI